MKNNFFLKLITSNSGLSSKRFIGGFILIVMTIACLICIGTQYEIQPNILALAITLVTTGGALLGLGVFDNKNSNNQLKSE